MCKYANSVILALIVVLIKIVKQNFGVAYVNKYAFDTPSV
jgi:hypothetical protein